MNCQIKENNKIKQLKSEYYNYSFNKETGFFARWGKSVNDDPPYAPMPEIADIEITTKCEGINGKPCPFCYKSNTPVGQNMSFETFKKIIDSLLPIVTQVALGTDSSCTSNPDIWKMMEYCRSKGVIPNVTVSQISDETADKLVNLCGAVSVSCYRDFTECYNAIHKLTSRGLKQVNIHKMISQQTFRETLLNLTHIMNDKRLENLNAFIFLSLKPKGRGETYTSISQRDFNILIEFCEKNKIRYGMDSCTSLKYMECISGYKDFEQRKLYIEPCESTLFSSYFNVDGNFFPCSFAEGTEGWEKGISIEGIKHFADVWYHPRTMEFREKLLDTKNNNKYNCRNCPIYSI